MDTRSMDTKASQPNRHNDELKASLAAGPCGPVEALFDQALDAMAQGDAPAAVVCFERLLAVQPNHNEAVHGLVRALEDAGRIDDALQLVQRLIAESPDDVLALTRLSMIYQHKGMVPEAEAAATRAKLLGWKLELQSGATSKTAV